MHDDLFKQKAILTNTSCEIFYGIYKTSAVVPDLDRYRRECVVFLFHGSAL